VASFNFLISPPSRPVSPDRVEDDHPALAEDDFREPFDPLPLAEISRSEVLEDQGWGERRQLEEPTAPPELESRGRVLLGYQASATYGLGSVWCWVDEEKGDGKLIDGWWEVKERNMGVVTEVTSGLAPGHHTLHCELLKHTLDPEGRTGFRIFAVMHD